MGEQFAYPPGPVTAMLYRPGCGDPPARGLDILSRGPIDWPLSTRRMASDPRPHPSFRPQDVGLFLLLAAFWGHSFLFIKIAVAAVPPIWIVTLRMAVGGCLLLGLVALLRRPLPRSGSVLATLVFVGVTGAALPWAGQAWAQQFLDSGLTAVLNSFTPVATLTIAVLAGQERLHRNRVLGLGIAVAGMLTVIRGEVGSGRSMVALIVAVASTTGYAIAGVVTRARISGRVSSLPAAAVQLLAGAAVLAPFAWARTGPPPVHVEPLVAFALAGLGVFGTGLGFLIYFTLIERVGATNAAMVTYFVPIIGIVSGALFRHERFGPNVFVGAALLIGGVWLSQRRTGLSGTPAPARVTEP